MTSKLLAVLAAAVSLAAPFLAQAQLTFKDDLGRPIILKTPAKRIVTLSPSLTEMVYAAGAGDLVVGVDSLSDFPPEAKRVPQVRTGAQFSVDHIAPLRPDLVLAWREGIRREQIDAITAYGASVFVAQARNLADIPRLLELLGRMTGRDTSAVVSDFELRLEAVRRANASKPRMSAFLEIWNRPLTTISGNHILSEALEVCRAENVFGELPGSAPKVTFEDVAREDPYVIVGAGSASNADEFRENWRIRQGLTAVRTNRLVYLESDAIQRPTPRTPEGIAQLCSTLDQVRFASAAPATMPVVAAPRTGAGGTAAPAPGASAAAATLLGKPPAPAAAGTIPPSNAPTATAQPAPATAPAQATPPAAAAPSQPRRPSQYGM